MARQAVLTAILGTGMTFVILTGGVDLSVGSIVALASVCGRLLIDSYDWSMWPAVWRWSWSERFAGRSTG